MIRVKICGITSLEDALTCVDAGADALGFVFVEGTPRHIRPAEAGAIIRALPPFVTPVGVFWDHPTGHVKAVVEASGVRALQFHGDESPEDVAHYALPVVKTIKVRERADLARMDDFRVAAFLLDSAARWSAGEPREPIEWELAREAATSRRIILSAGLTPDNVARAVATARPWAVDVNSGVEARPGRKDGDKIRRFVREARGA